MTLKQIALLFAACFFAAANAAIALGRASVQASAMLATNQTTPDGRLTFVAHVSDNATLQAVALSIRNNDFRTVVVDAFRVSGNSGPDCSGSNLHLRGDQIVRICDIVSASPGQGTGHASLMLALTWHEQPRPRPSASPVPSPSPTLQ